MFQPQIFDDQTDIARLLRVEERRLAFADRAEAAAARADIPQDQKRSGTMAPALPYVRAARLLANGVKVVVP